MHLQSSMQRDCYLWMKLNSILYTKQLQKDKAFVLLQVVLPIVLPVVCHATPDVIKKIIITIISITDTFYSFIH